MGVSSYRYSSGEIEGIVITYLFSPSPNWFLGINVYVRPPYAENDLRNVRGFVESIVFE